METTLEEALVRIKEINDIAENTFWSDRMREPNLENPKDILLLGNYLDVSAEAKRAEVHTEDIVYDMMRRYLVRFGWFGTMGDDKIRAFDGLLGRVCYNPPIREIEFRIRNLRFLKDEGVEFPHGWVSLVGMIQKIRDTYVAATHMIIKSEERGDTNPNFSDKFRSHLANPPLNFLQQLEDDEQRGKESATVLDSYGFHIERWKRYIEVLSEFGENELSYK